MKNQMKKNGSRLVGYGLLGYTRSLGGTFDIATPAPSKCPTVSMTPHEFSEACEFNAGRRDDPLLERLRLSENVSNQK